MKRNGNHLVIKRALALCTAAVMLASVMPLTAMAEWRHSFHEHTWEEERAYRLTASLSSLHTHTTQDYPGKDTKKESYPPQTEICLSWGCAGIGTDDQTFRKQIQRGYDDSGNPIYEPDPNDYDVSEKMTRVTISQGGYKDGREYGLISPEHGYPCYWYTTDGETWDYKGPELMYENLQGCWEIDSLMAYGRWVVAGGAFGGKSYKKGPTYTAYKWRGTVKKGIRQRYYDDWGWNTYTYDPYKTLKGEKPVATMKIGTTTSTVSVSVKSVRIYSNGQFCINVHAPTSISKWGGIGFHVVAPIAKWSPYYKKGEREWAVAETGIISDNHIIKRGNTLSYVGYIPSWDLVASKYDEGRSDIGNQSGGLYNIVDFRPGETKFDIRVVASGATSGRRFFRTNDKTKGGNSRSAWVVLPTAEDYARLDANDPTPTIFNCKKDFIGNVKIDKITQRTEDVSSSAKRIVADVEWSCDEYGFNKKTPRVIRSHHLDPAPETYYNGISGYLNVYKCLDSGKEWLSNTQRAIGGWTNPESIDSFRTDGTGRAHFKSTVVLGYTTDNDCDRYRIEACAFPTPYNANWAYATEHDRIKNYLLPYPDQDAGYVRESGDRGFGESNVYYYNASSTDAAGEMWAGQASPDSPAWAKRYVVQTCKASGHRYVLDKDCRNAAGCRYVCEVCGEEKHEAHKFGSWTIYEDEEGIKWHSHTCAVCGYEERHAYDEEIEIVGERDACIKVKCANCGEYVHGTISSMECGHIITFEDNGNGTHKVYCKQCGYVFAESEDCGETSDWLNQDDVRYDLSTLKRGDNGNMTCVCGHGHEANSGILSSLFSLFSLDGTVPTGIFGGTHFTALDPTSEVDAKEEQQAEIETISKQDYAVQVGNDAYINTFESMCDAGKDPENASDLAEVRAAAEAAAVEAAEAAEAEYDTEITPMSLFSTETISNDIISKNTTAGISGVGEFKTLSEAAARIALHSDALKASLDAYNTAAKADNPDAADVAPSDTSLKIGVATKVAMESYTNSGDDYSDDDTTTSSADDEVIQLFSNISLFDNQASTAQIKYNVSAVEKVTAEKDGKEVASSEKTLTNADTGISSALVRLPLPADFGSDGQPVKIEYKDTNNETKTVYALIATDADVLAAADEAETEDEEEEILEDETEGTSDLRVCFTSENPLTSYTISASPEITSEYSFNITSGVAPVQGKFAHSVSYDANTGTGEMEMQIIENDTSAALKDNEFTAPLGKEFDSWNTQADGNGTRYAENEVVTPDSALVLYAIWREPACTVTYKSRYSGVMDEQIITKNTPTALNLNTFDAPDDESGRVFKCWNTAWDGSGTSYADGEIVTLTDSSLTLYAQWEVPKATYTVTFNQGEGGSGDMPPQTFTEGEMRALKANEFTREGYTFRYWLTDNNEIYTDKQPLTLSNNINLTAVWVSNNVTVNFYDGHGGTFIAAQHIPRNTPTALRKNTAVNNGGAFRCWSNNTGTVTYTDEQEITFDNNYGETLNLFAEWVGDGTTGVTITFNRNEDFVYGVMSDYIALSGVETTLPKSTFTHKQKEFMGWNTEPDGNGIHYDDEARITVTSDTTLYAEWQYKEMNLTLHYGNNTYVQNIRYHDTEPIETPPWTNGGYALVGWTRTEGKQIIDYKPGADYYMISNENLYAVWADPRTITFASGDGSGAMDSITVPYYDGNNYNEAHFYLPKCTFTPPAGKVFAFWTRNSADPNAPSKYYDMDGMVASSNYNLYANYTDDYNTVTYHSNYGDDETVKQYIVKSGSTQALANMFTRDGYVFEKWAKNPDGTGSQGTYITKGTDFDLYAQWTKEARVTLCANYGDNPDTEEVTLTGSFVAIPQPFEAPENCTFRSWNTKADGTGKIYTGYYNSSDGDTTLYAQWDKSVVVTYHSNNGSGETTQQSFSGYAYMEYNTFTAPDGYAFAGWAETPDADKKKYSDHYFINSSSLTTYDLYAVWTPQVKITLDANGGVGSYEQIFAKGTSGYITKFTDTGIIPPLGKEFDCWNTKADGKGSKKTESSYGTYSGIVGDNMTLYAQWKDSTKNDVSELILFNDQTVTYSGAEQTAKSAFIIFDGQDEFTRGNGGAFTYTYKDSSGSDLEGLPKNAGEYTVTASYTDTYNYGSKSITLTIDPKPVTVTQIYAENKIYDGTDKAEFTTARGVDAADNECDGVLFDGLVDGDDLAVTAESAAFVEGEVTPASFSLASAGGIRLLADDNLPYGSEQKLVKISGLTLMGDDADNYELTSTDAETTAIVTGKPLTVEGLKVNNKSYDGTKTATVDISNATLSGVVEGEEVRIESARAVFEDAEIGNGKTAVVYSITLSGADAEHYSVNGMYAMTANITEQGTEPTPEVSEITSLIDGVTVEKAKSADGISIRVTPAETDMQKAKLYKAVYATDGSLASLTVTEAEKNGDSIVIPISEPDLSDGESYKLMLWDTSQRPLISAITSADTFFN